MPTLEEVTKFVRQMSDDDRAELRRILDEIDNQEWDKERTEATRAFHAAGLTDEDIDEAVRKLRYEGRP